MARKRTGRINGQDASKTGSSIQGKGSAKNGASKSRHQQTGSGPETGSQSHGHGREKGGS